MIKLIVNYIMVIVVRMSFSSQARWNGTMLQSEDVSKSVMAALSKQEGPTDFENF